MVSSSLFISEGSEHQAVRSPLITYTERFYEVLPYYMSIGMTYEQYWDGDPMLAKYYREAEEIRNERKNQELWLQGMYIYEALCDVAPILHSFAKKGTKPAPYSDTPYAITEKQRIRIENERERKMAMKGKMFMQSLMASTNKKFEEVK